MDMTARDVLAAASARTRLPLLAVALTPETATDEEIVATLLAVMAGAAQLAEEVEAYRAACAAMAYERGATTDQIGAVDGITGEGARRKWKLPPKPRGTGKRIPATKVAERVAPENGA